MMINISEKIDSELGAALAYVPMPEGDSMFDWEHLPNVRAMMEQWATPAPENELVSKEERHIPGLPGNPEVLVRVYRPTQAIDALPALLWIHGGGFVMGSMKFSEPMVQQIVEEVGCMVVSVEYRLAPEHPYPAPLHDCYAALQWMHTQAADLGIDAKRIAVGGESAGGGLAVALTLLTRDQRAFPINYLWLTYPMLDDRNITESSRTITDPRLWNRVCNEQGWHAYLGDQVGSGLVSPYAAPARETNLHKLPPTFLAVGTLDLFLDEDLAFAQRLVEAGTQVELHIYTGGIHGMESLAPEAKISQRLINDRLQALKAALRA